jgi:dipeptidyl-peptidase-4
MDGTIARQITKGSWDITDFYGIDERKNTIYYQSTELSPVQRNIFSIDAKGKKICLADAKGKNSAWFSHNFNYYVHEFSSVTEADKLTVRSSNGSKIRDLQDNPALTATLQSAHLNNKEFFSFSTSENIQLNGWMLKPSGFDPKIKYPVVMIQYSGPGSQLALNEWNIGWEYYLSKKGYFVVCVDGRGTASRGAGFMKSTYKQLGVLEANDQIETAKYLGSLSYIDKDRIGIWGWSYGGSVVLWAMSSGEKVFKAGISVAPVTDWRFYNTPIPNDSCKHQKKTSQVTKARQHY